MSRYHNVLMTKAVRCGDETHRTVWYSVKGDLLLSEDVRFKSELIEA